MFEQYKPLRNYLRKFGIRKSFEELWGFFQYRTNGQPALPATRQWQALDFHRNVHPWNLALLTRELVLNAQRVGTASLRNYDDFVGAMNRIGGFEEAISKKHVSTENVLEHLHLVSHQQFPWQRNHPERDLIRYIKIFGEERLEGVVRDKTGLSMEELYVMGLAIGGALVRQSGINANYDFTPFGIPLDRTRAFISRVSTSLQALREKLRDLQRLDETWAYTWNPLEAKPLVSLDPANPHLLHCPIPHFMMRRFSAGIYYEIVKETDFDNAFGQSYERYVGDVLHEIFPQQTFSIVKPKAYEVRREVHHGPDWILSDDHATVVIECKTKRLPIAGKISTDPEQLRRHLIPLADAVVQSYKNIDEALRGLASWQPDGRPIYPLVITLEDWYLMSPSLHATLRELIEEGLEKVGLSKGMASTMPYCITSIIEFELTGQAIAQVGIKPVLGLKMDEKYRDWHLSGFTAEMLPGKLQSYRQLFREEWEAVAEKIRDRAPADVRGQRQALLQRRGMMA